MSNRSQSGQYQWLIDELNSNPSFHGTVIYCDEVDSIEDLDFHPSSLELGTGDLPALWVSEEGVAERFSRYHSCNTESEIYSVSKVLLNIQNPFIYDPHVQASPYVEVDGSEYHISGDREELFDALIDEGYDCIIAMHNYGSDEHDVALLSSEALTEIVSVKLSANQKDWTEYFNLEKAEKEFQTMASLKLTQ